MLHWSPHSLKGHDAATPAFSADIAPRLPTGGKSEKDTSTTPPSSLGSVPVCGADGGHPQCHLVASPTVHIITCLRMDTRCAESHADSYAWGFHLLFNKEHLLWGGGCWRAESPSQPQVSLFA